MSDELILIVIFALTCWWAIGLFRKKPSANAAKSRPGGVFPTESKEAKAKTGPAEDKPLVTIYYGSQAGTAEQFAQELGDEAQSQGFRSQVVDLDDFDESEFTETSFAVFLLATFGEGEPTDNAQTFYEWVMSEDRVSDTILNDMKFAVFALGNRQYEHFCAVGRHVDKQLRRLGAHAVLELGEGDDDGSLEDDYVEWKGRFWQAARAQFNLSGETGEEEAFKPAVGIMWYAQPGDPADDKKRPAVPASYVGGLEGFQRNTDPKHRAELATVIVNKELNKSDSEERSVRHLEIDISTVRFKYLTADNLGVFPRNDFKQAAQLAKRLGVDPRAVFKLEKKSPAARKLPLPSPCSVGDALLWYCDFNSLARVKLLKILAQYASAEEKARLLHIANDQPAREAWLAEEKSVMEVLNDFPSVQPPFEHFLEWCPKLQPRYYTISSSSKVHPKTIHLTVALTRIPKKDGRVHLGVCSSYLAQAREGHEQLCIFVRSSSFRLPKRPQAPVIMVGPGTGVAPFRAFVQEAVWVQKQASATNATIIKTHYSLFFGCRHRDHDFIYRDELECAHTEGSLTCLHTAFSREQKEKVYVQHKIHENAAELWKLVHEEKASFYVCGSAHMGRGVREAFTQIAERVGGLSAERAAEYVKSLQNENRYIQELWSS